MRSVLLPGFALLAAAVVAHGAEWRLIKAGGRDHVTIENIADFYGLGTVRRVSNEFTLSGGRRSLRGNANSVEFFINGLKFNLSYPVLEQDGHLLVSRMDLTKIIEPVMRPGRIDGAEKVETIVLDAGHGGHDNGAFSTFGWEKDFTLDVVNRARALFQQLGYKVVLTRTSDTFIPLSDRVHIANQYKSALFISIHFNSGGAGTGLETYTLAPRGVPSMMADGPRISDLEACAGQAHDAENMALATATHAALVVRSRMYDRGIKRARFVVIRDIQIPGVLIEGGFLSNTYDAKLIATPAYRQQMATSIAQAVQNYRRAIAPPADGVVVARKFAEPRVDLNAPVVAAEETPAASREPVVVTPTAPRPEEPATAAEPPTAEVQKAAEAAAREHAEKAAPPTAQTTPAAE